MSVFYVLVSAQYLVLSLHSCMVMSVLWGNLLFLVTVVCAAFLTSVGRLGIVLFGGSFCASLYIGFSSSSWFGVGVWLIFMSGLMVVFLFFCSLGSSLEVGGISSIGVVLVFLGVGGSAGLGATSHSELMVFYSSVSGGMLWWWGAFLLFIMVVVMKSLGGGGGSRE